MMEEELERMFIKSSFYEIDKILKKMSMDKQKNILISIANETENISIYTYINYRIFNEKDLDAICNLHEIALALLMYCFNCQEGAYSAAFYHAKRVAELKPNNIENFVQLLFFYDIPEHILDKKEAKKIARRIIDVDPNNPIAKRILINE